MLNDFHWPFDVTIIINIIKLVMMKKIDLGKTTAGKTYKWTQFNIHVDQNCLIFALYVKKLANWFKQ